MPWFKVDDNLAFHPKVLKAGNRAMGLWLRAGCWSAQMLTDGLVPPDVVASIAGKPDECPSCGKPDEASLPEALIASGLWLPDRAGFRFHEWDQRQPTKASVEARRAVDRARKRGRARAGDAP